MCQNFLFYIRLLANGVKYKIRQSESSRYTNVSRINIYAQNSLHSFKIWPALGTEA